MQIGFVIYGNITTLTGGYLYDRFLTDYLRAQGHQVKIISIPRHTYSITLLHNLWPRIYHTLTQDPYDLLIQDELSHPSLFRINERVRRRKQIPVITLIHALRTVLLRHSPLRKLYQTIEYRYLKSVDGAIYTSYFSKEQTEHLLSHSKPSVVAWPAGNRFRNIPSREEIEQRVYGNEFLELVFLGNLHPGKRLHTLLDALTEISHRRFSLHVIGSLERNSKYVNGIRRQIQRMDLRHKVLLYGELTGSPLESRLRNSHILVVPSDSEAFGMAYLEGFAFGLPAVASAVGGASEIVHHGENGFLVQPGDASQLARYLRTIDENRQLLCQMSLNAQNSYHTHPTWDESMEKIHQFLSSFIAAH